MPLVTAIEEQQRRRRFNVFVDGEFALALEPETIAAAGLRIGMPVTAAVLAELLAADLRKRALYMALQLLSYRPRAEREIRTRLQRRGLPSDVIDVTVAKLRDYGYVDDAAFARAWVESREAGSPRGQRLLRNELRGKGIAVEVAAEATAGVAEDEAARRAAAKKARTLRGLDYPQFRTRLGGYLARRGFGYDVISPIVDELWQAQGAPLPDEPPWVE